MIEQRLLRFDSKMLDGVELPVVEARGSEPGPRVCLIAGIHGCEYASMEGLRRFMAGLDHDSLRGSIVAVPIVNMTAFRARSPFVTPEDGKNLNRCFPGDPEGTFSEVLAHHVFRELIEPSDALIDLHGGDLVEALEPFTLYDESPVQERAHELAMAFGIRYIIRSERNGTAIGGTTSAAAADAGIPGIIPEAGGCGQMDEPSIAAHVSGLGGALRSLGVLPGDPPPAPPGGVLVKRFVWLRSKGAGWWDSTVEPGQTVAEGEPLGAVRDVFGVPLEEITSPENGVILFVTSSPAVAADGILCAVGAGLEPLA
jgi:predicted deacylase